MTNGFGFDICCGGWTHDVCRPRVCKSQVHVYILPQLGSAISGWHPTSLPSTHLSLLLIRSLDMNFY